MSIQAGFPLVPAVAYADIGTAAGMDVGAVRPAALSDGRYYAPLKDLARPVEAKIAVLQQRIKHTKKGSCRDRQLKQRSDKLYGRAADLRHNCLPQTTGSIVKNHGYVMAEDLNLKGMTKSASGPRGKPGSRVRARAGLHRSIPEAGVGELVRQPEYKLKLKGFLSGLIGRFSVF